VFPEDYLSDGLRDLGYIEGKSILIEWRRVLGTSGETNEELRSLVTDLVRSKVDLIVAFSTPAARAALQTTKIPVVFVAGDPVGSGLAASLARPGGKGPGVSMLMPETGSKRMELLRHRAEHSSHHLLDEFLQPAECASAGRGTKNRSNA
jgi:ABC-type uncharacterized transport system substrate-binding protein